MKIIREHPSDAATTKISLFDINELSRFDGPGLRCVLFFQGCSTNCEWCHSPHSQPKISPLLYNKNLCVGCGRCVEACSNQVHSFLEGEHIVDRKNCTHCAKCIEACPNSVDGVSGSALNLPTVEVSVDALYGQIEPYLKLCKANNGGITLSGGEALLQLDGVAELLTKCKENGIHTAIETSGLLPLSVYRGVLDQVDLWLFGMRIITSKSGVKHKERIEASLKLLLESGAKVLPRIPMVPSYFDRSDVMSCITSLIERYSIEEVCLSEWNRDYDHYYSQSGQTATMKPPSDDEIAECKKIITNQIINLKCKLYENKNDR